VKQALRFVQLLPRQYVDARTYNMLLRVCAQAGDLRNAMHVSDMLQAAGLKLDGILYTTLISGERAWLSR
jgi:pentatricopeptide repeat protein